jgi:hypothetical protein
MQTRMNTTLKTTIAAAFALIPFAATAQTEVPLLLLTELSSGGSDEGKRIAFLVTQDVKGANDNVLIPKGSIAYGKVVWSRAAGAVSKFLNEPARLAISLETVAGADDKPITLVANGADEKGVFHFHGGNTGIQRASDAVEEVLNDPEAKKALEAMLGGLIGKEMGSNEVVALLAKRLSLANIAKLIEVNSLGDLVGTFKSIAAGEITRIGTAHAGLVIEAITELTGLRKSVGDRIAGLFKGRNIRAYPGTPIVAIIKAPQPDPAR